MWCKRRVNRSRLQCRLGLNQRFSFGNVVRVSWLGNSFETNLLSETFRDAGSVAPVVMSHQKKEGGVDKFLYPVNRDGRAIKESH